MNTSGPSTDPCGTEHVTSTACEILPLNRTVNVLPVKYDLQGTIIKKSRSAEKIAIL